jgi:hypothetical protein
MLNFQNCTGSYFITKGMGIKMGGEPYDGFNPGDRIMHHYESGFTCEGRSQPESILLRTDSMSWVLTQNSAQKCAELDQVPVSGVVYDEPTRTAVFKGKTYIAPKPYKVVAAEDPNLPDEKIEDGVCEDVNKKCSLRAAFENVGFINQTGEGVIQIPAGRYMIGANGKDHQMGTDNIGLPLFLSKDGFPIRIIGEGSSTTVLDGQGITSILELGMLPIAGDGSLPSQSIEITGLAFRNGVASMMSYVGAAITAGSLGFRYSGSLSIRDCIFEFNRGQAAISATAFGLISKPDYLMISQSAFRLNDGAGIINYLTPVGGVIDQVHFESNLDAGIKINNVARDFIVKNSTFNMNGTGLVLRDCSSCKIQNSTIHGNNIAGAEVSKFMATGDPSKDLIVENTTLSSNGAAPGGKSNLYFSSIDPTFSVNLFNTIVTKGTLPSPNCATDPGRPFKVLASHSLFDDDSCLATGTGLIKANPLLGPLAPNGGFTLTIGFFSPQ